MLGGPGSVRGGHRTLWHSVGSVHVVVDGRVMELPLRTKFRAANAAVRMSHGPYHWERINSVDSALEKG